MRNAELVRKIKLYIKRYNKDTFKSKKINEALWLIRENRVRPVLLKEFPTIKVFIVKGRRSVYLTIKNSYCSCYGFTMSIMRGKIKPCYHLLACELIKKPNLPPLRIPAKLAFDKALTQSLEEFLSR